MEGLEQNFKKISNFLNSGGQYLTLMSTLNPIFLNNAYHHVVQKSYLVVLNIEERSREKTKKGVT